jgi:hypothetical protein
MAARAAEQAFNAAMATAQGEIAPVVRNDWNPHTKSRFASLDAVYQTVKPIVTKHGFGTSFGTARAETPGCLGMTCDVTHAAGFAKRFVCDVPLDGAGFKGNANMTGTQAFGSTTSYARRYMTLMIFDVAVQKADHDGNAAPRLSGEIVSDEQLARLTEIMRRQDTDVAAFCAYFKVPDVASLPVERFADALTALGRSRRAAR